MAYERRNYQVEAIAECFAALSDRKRDSVLLDSPVGSGKTYMSTIYGYKSCVDERFIGVTVVPCESHSTIGALPGDLDEKMDPDVQPLKNAMRNYLISEDKSFRKKFPAKRRSVEPNWSVPASGSDSTGRWLKPGAAN